MKKRGKHHEKKNAPLYMHDHTRCIFVMCLRQRKQNGKQRDPCAYWNNFADSDTNPDAYTYSYANSNLDAYANANGLTGGAGNKKQRTA